jgi:hypothetical protein
MLQRTESNSLLSAVVVFFLSSRWVVGLGYLAWRRISTHETEGTLIDGLLSQISVVLQSNGLYF